MRDHEFVHVQAKKVGELDYTRRNCTGDLVVIQRAERREVTRHNNQPAELVAYYDWANKTQLCIAQRTGSEGS